MKSIKYKLYISCFLLAGLMVGCGEDFLDRPPIDAITDVNFYKTSEQVLAGSAPLYGIVWFSYNDKASHGIGDGRGGVLTSGSYQLENIQFFTSSVTPENGSAWASFYNVIAQSNTLIKNIQLYGGPDVPENIKRHAIAEARFMRGLAYSFLVQNWEAVPIIEDNTTLLQDTTISRNTPESIWEFITRDIRYGVTNLPETPIKPGRLTKYSAEGLLAKVYLTRSGMGASSATSRNQVFLDSARIFAEDVVVNSDAKLLENYEDLFKVVNNNNEETLFALQWTYNGTWGSQNSVQAFLAYGSSITGFGDGWGGDIGASLYQLGKYEGLLTNGNTPDVRRKASFMFPGDHYTYIHMLAPNPDTGDPEEQELRVPSNAGGNNRAWVKKYVVGRPVDNIVGSPPGRVLQQRTEIQTYMLRLADVYLTYAEAAMGNGGTVPAGDALDAFNAVRERAGLPPKAIVGLQDIYDERQVEFAMEGQLWYDNVRRHYFDPQQVYDDMSDQERGSYRITPDKVPDPTKWTITLDAAGSKKYVVNGDNFFLPLPATELSRAPNLRKAPVDYDFNK